MPGIEGCKQKAANLPEREEGKKRGSAAKKGLKGQDRLLINPS
jgi:hypothetical protein